MYLLIYADTWSAYFTNRNKITKELCADLRARAIENPHNKLVVSKKYIDLILEYFRENDTDCDGHLENIFGLSIDNLINDDRTESFAGNNSATLSAEFTFLLENYPANVFLAICENKSKGLNHKNLAYISDAKKPNLSWLKLSLAANAEKDFFSVSYTDFANNNEIENFFTDLFQIPKKLTTISIQDTYLNFDKHQNFDFICKKEIEICYYTSGLEKNIVGQEIKPQTLDSNWQKIKSKFGEPVKYYTTMDKTLLHQRALLFENIIIEPSHDFMKVNKENKSWRLNIQLSEKETNEFKRKFLKFHLQQTI